MNDGFYDDTLVRTPDGWKISQRTVKVVSAVVEESSQLSARLRAVSPASSALSSLPGVRHTEKAGGVLTGRPEESPT
ncbi:hypothetical protein HET69_14315 [Streptomyces sp. CJ_13]|nr:hypothetical protein [Streptomyces sp. CJ_13]